MNIVGRELQLEAEVDPWTALQIGSVLSHSEAPLLQPGDQNDRRTGRSDMEIGERSDHQPESAQTKYRLFQPPPSCQQRDRSHRYGDL